MARSNFRKGRGKKVYSIVVDGKTEAWYLQMLKKNERLQSIKIKPDLPKKKRFSELFDYVSEQAKYYDKVIWIIDLDTIVAEAKQKKDLKETMQKVAQDISQLEENGVIVIVNNPCLEEWLLLHFDDSAKYYHRCEDAERVLRHKDYLVNYQKTEHYYKSSNDIYSKLKDRLHNAILRGKKLGNFDENQAEKAIAEMYKLFDFLNIK